MSPIFYNPLSRWITKGTLLRHRQRSGPDIDDPSSSPDPKSRNCPPINRSAMVRPSDRVPHLFIPLIASSLSFSREALFLLLTDLTKHACTERTVGAGRMDRRERRCPNLRRCGGPLVLSSLSLVSSTTETGKVHYFLYA